jgi:sensor histidine kinase YesM
VTAKEAVMTEQTRGKIAAYAYEHKIELLNKEKLITDQQVKLQQEQLMQESLQKKILVISIAAILLISIIVFRNISLNRKNEKIRLQNELQLERLQNEKAKSEMQQQATELEMQALRAQMNPHFIFNCLNSINRFIINNDGLQAADYLTKFAKLIRIVLEQSGKPLVPLEDELKCLQLYMDLEALRFETPFQYKINCNGTNISSVMIPTLLIQPFVENAIWHGLQGNRHKIGKIDINMHVQDNILHCKICDNGIGRTSTAIKDKMASGKTSMGIKLTEHRLQLSDMSKLGKWGVEIHDLVNEEGFSNGTCVDIKIPIKEI